MKVRKKKSKSLKILKSVVLVLFLSLLFIPENINRSVIAGIAIAGIWGSLLFLIVPRLPRIPSPALKRKSAYSSGNLDGITDMETLLWRQISYQITGKLKSAYPDATWEFIKEPNVDSLLKEYWAALTDIFILDELNAKETEDTLELSWM